MLHLYLIMGVDRQKEEEFNFNINERINMIKKEENKEENNNEMVDNLDQFLEDDEIDRKN